MDIERVRADTPGCESVIHLNNAGAALPPSSVLRAVREHLDLEGRIGGYEAADARQDRIDAAYAHVGALIGAEPAHIAFTESATASTAQALSSIPFERGDVVLTTQSDYVSNQIQLLSLSQRLGVRLVRAPDAPEGGVDAAAAAQLIRELRPKIVCVTHVPTNSGLVQNVAALGGVCQELGVWYLVDACQSAGQMPLDVAAIGCDFLAATSRKFLRGPRGAGFLYVSERALESGLAPLMVDSRGAEWLDADRFRLVDGARRFELYERSWPIALGMAEAARYANALGLAAIEERIKQLAQRLRAELAEIDRVRVLDRGPQLCGIVSIAVEGHDPRDLMLALRAQGIHASAQGRPFAVIDFDAKGVTGSLRFSPHYYNTEGELARAVAALRELVAARR